MISMTEDEFHFEGVVLGFPVVVCGSVLQIFTFFHFKTFLFFTTVFRPADLKTSFQI